MDTEVELCMGPGLVAQRSFGSGRRSNVSNQKQNRTFRALTGHYFFRKEKLVHSYSQLKLVTQSDSGNKSDRIDFLGDFRSCPKQAIVRDDTLQTWDPVSLYPSSNAKIIPQVLRALLNNPFKDGCINRKNC
jgi:hypothetical protein